MNAKKVFGMLFFSSAFTRRNISSVVLVGFFFLVFILAGGKIDTHPLPKASPQGMFGGAEANYGIGLPAAPKKKRAESVQGSRELLGVVPSKERARRESSDHTKGRIFTNDEADASSKEKIDRSGLIQGYKKVYQSDRERRAVERAEKYQRREVDPLEAIQERLRRLK